jgi:hypothetical protein
MLIFPSNLQTKILEVRDIATHIPVLAVRMLAQNDIQAWYIHGRCGYPKDGSCIAMMNLNDCAPGNVDPYAWGDRTYATAHHYIYEHFGELKNGDVVDVEFILGEKPTKKVSERVSA